MGQYRQWLHYRGIDQLLRSQLAVSRHELEQLQAQVEVLGKQVFPANNAIFQALIQTQLNNSAHLQQAREQERLQAKYEAQRARMTLPNEHRAGIAPTISPALSAWGQLPNLNPQAAREPGGNSSTWTPQVTSSISEEYLLPPDIGAFIDAHMPTSPQAKRLQSLHIAEPEKLAVAEQEEQEEQEGQPVDQQSEHTDHLVERWFERWGEESTARKRSWKDQRE